MRMLKLLPALILGLFIGVSSVNAEQIRLSDGRYLQGDVVEVKEEGFVFKLTETGGQVFLRWNQVDAGLKKRLNNEKDPDEGLNLEVMVDGARLELIDGSVLLGEITRAAGGYRVTNFDLSKGKVIPEEDVIEEGFVPDIKIPAIVMMDEAAVMQLAETEREPVETARQYYELARIADKLALYEQAKDYVTLALASGPDGKLQARLSEYETELDELIRQAAVLKLLVEARKDAKKHLYQRALNILNEAKVTYKPTGPVLSKVDDTYDEIDLDYTKFVINEWYQQMKPVARDWLRLKENKEVTAASALNWARRSMEQAIMDKLAEIVGGGDPRDIKERFGGGSPTPNTNPDQRNKGRFNLEADGHIRLSLKKCSFGEDGFYRIVRGNREISGRKPSQDPNPDSGGRDDGREGPRGRDRDGVDDPSEQGFQESDGKGDGIPLPDGVTKEDVEDFLRRVRGNDDKDDADKPVRSAGPNLEELDDPPKFYPSLTEWWDKAGTTTRAKWMVAVYVTQGGTMFIPAGCWKDWDVRFK